ncbi:MAG: alpha/beta hydrolase, partial [Alphaproteobacteria bacterium]|nr:alpha/beta hydrolase [Alphaproteobacteria bacterium]
MGNRRGLAGACRCAGAAIALAVGVPHSLAADAPPVSLDLPYGRAPEQRLDVCRPAEPHPPARGVLLIHGGGWIGGDKAEFLGFCALAAQHGLVGIPVNYRLVAGPAGPIWPAPLQDVQLAVRWVRAHAAELGVDPERICAMGDSAGGQLAVFLAVLAAVAAGDQADQLAAVSPRIACAIDISGPVDLGRWPASAPLAPRLFGTVTGPTLAAAARDASPLALVTAATAPMMVIHGVADPLV